MSIDLRCGNRCACASRATLMALARAVPGVYYDALPLEPANGAS